MGLKKGAEVFTEEKSNEVLRISSIEELEKQLGGIDIKGIENKFKIPLITSKEELLRIKEELTISETSTKLKDFLESKGVFGQIGEKFRTAQEKFKSKIKPQEASEALLNGDETLGEQISAAVDEASNSELAKKTKATIGKGQEKAKKVFSEVKETGAFAAAMEWIVSFFKKILSWVGLDKFFNFGDKAKDLVKKLAPKEVEETKKQLNAVAEQSIDIISKNIEKTDLVLLPGTKEELHKLFQEPDFFSPEELALINQKFKKGEIKSLSDLLPLINKEKYDKIQSTIFNKDQKDYLAEGMKKKVEETIAKKYGIKLDAFDSEKRKKLRKLIEQYRSTEDILIITEKFQKHEGVTIGELFSTSAIVGANLSIFTLRLISNGIIGLNDYTTSFFSETNKMISIGLNGLGIKIPVTDDVLKQIKKLPDEEKKFMFGVIWRHGQIGVSLLKNLTFFSSRGFIETVIGDVESSTITGWNSLMNNFEGKVASLEKLEIALNGNSTGIAKEALKHTQQLKNETQVISLLTKHGNDSQLLIEKLKQRNNCPYSKKIIEEIEKGTEISTVKRNLSNSIKSIDRTSRPWDRMKEKTASLWKGDFSQTETALYDYYKGLDSIRKNNLRLLEGNFNKIGGLIKYRDFIESMKLSRNGNRIILEGSLQEQVHSTNMLKKMANDFPGLLGDLLGTAMLTFSFIGLSKEVSEEDKGYIEAIGENLKYVIPTIGPTFTIWETEINKLDAKDATALASMTLFGLMDITAVTKYALAGEWGKIVSYHTRFLTAPLHMPGHIANQIRTAKAFRAAGGKFELGMLKSSTKNISKLAKSKSVRVFAAALALYGASVFMKSGREKEIERLTEEGFISDSGYNYEKIKTGLTQKEKKYFIEEVIFNNGNDVSATLEGDKLSVVSKNKEIQGDWIITRFVEFELLNALGVDIDSIDFKYDA